MENLELDDETEMPDKIFLKEIEFKVNKRALEAKILYEQSTWN